MVEPNTRLKTTNLTNKNLKGKFSQKPGEFMKNGKRYLRVVAHDGVRDLIIPNPMPNVNVGVFCPEEIQEYSSRRKLGSEEVEKKVLESTKKREQEATLSALRKKELQSFPTFKEYGPRLNKLEMEAEAKANFLLNRAKEIREEDDDNIKLANKLILGTKCQAIRDAQVAEKKTIEQELKEEETRLDAMMEQERKRMLAKEQLDNTVEVDKKEAYKKAINDQVHGNELEREMEAERLVEEAKIIRDAALQCQIDELRQLEKKIELQRKVRDDLNKINQSMLERTEREKNMDKLADLKIQEFMRQKAEMEMKREEEVFKLKAEREKDLAKVRAQQKKTTEDQAQKSAIRAQRQLEQYERQWREKEKKVAADKTRKSEQLKRDRLKQIEEKKRAQAVEAEKERKETFRQLIIDQEISKREKEEEEKRKEEADTYKASLLKQINEKEYERIKQRQLAFEEGISAKIEMKSHEEFLKSIIRKKIANLRTHNVPDKYIQDIEKRFHL